MGNKQKAQEVIERLTGEIKRLEEMVVIVQVDRDFDAAEERLIRWKRRTVRYLKQEVSDAEGDNLDDTELRQFQQGETLENFIKETRLYAGVLKALIEELRYDPDIIRRLETSATSIPPVPETQRIELPEPQRIWLESLYSKMKRGEATDRRSLTIELMGKLPKGFDPAEIHSKLLRGESTKITLLGIAALDPDSALIIKANAVIQTVKKILTEDPKKEEVNISDVLQHVTPLGEKIEDIEAEEIGITAIEVADIFEKLSLLGMLHGSGTIYGPKGWGSINIDDQVFNNYLKYESVEQMLESLFPVPSASIPQSPLPKTTASSESAEIPVTIDVFLSYSSQDIEEARQLSKAIKRAGGKVFMAEKSLIPGDEFAEEIKQALWAARELWLLVSPNSLKSEWVISEWGAAWVLGRRIVPILLRCESTQLSERLRSRQCIDFHKYAQLIKGTFQKR